MGWATKWGFKGSAFIALIDILLVKQITERKAQLARCCSQCLAFLNYGAVFQVCLLHHPPYHHGCWMDGRN